MGHSCDFGWAGGTKEVVLPEVYYETCPGDLQHPPTPTPGHQDDPQIASITINPGTINPGRVRTGESTTLTVTLDRPAPSGGFAVGIAHTTNTGLDAAIVDGYMPYSLTFQAGASRFPYEIRTQYATDDTTDIVFTAFHYNDQKSAELFIVPGIHGHGR